jgi:hypothetical protein
LDRAGLPKKAETYYFFRIHNVDEFRSRLIQLLPLITTTAQVMKTERKLVDIRNMGQRERRC